MQGRFQLEISTSTAELVVRDEINWMCDGEQDGRTPVDHKSSLGVGDGSGTAAGETVAGDRESGEDGLEGRYPDKAVS